MKKYHKILIIFGVIAIILVIGLAGTKYFEYYSLQKLKYSREYIIGEENIKGEVDKYYFQNISKDFEIGANEYGYAVFKNPQKALEYLKENYKDGISLIKKEYDLMELTEENYELYGIYGCQVTTGNEKEKLEARFVSEFIDIYENSFAKK